MHFLLRFLFKSRLCCSDPKRLLFFSLKKQTLSQRFKRNTWGVPVQHPSVTVDQLHSTLDEKKLFCWKKLMMLIPSVQHQNILRVHTKTLKTYSSQLSPSTKFTEAVISCILTELSHPFFPVTAFAFPLLITTADMFSESHVNYLKPGFPKKFQMTNILSDRTWSHTKRHVLVLVFFIGYGLYQYKKLGTYFG